MIVKFFWDAGFPWSQDHPRATMSSQGFTDSLGLDLAKELGLELRTRESREVMEAMRTRQSHFGANVIRVDFSGDEVTVWQCLDDEPGYLVLKETEFYRLLDDFLRYVDGGPSPDESHKYEVERVVPHVPPPDL